MYPSTAKILVMTCRSVMGLHALAALDVLVTRDVQMFLLRTVP